MAIPYGLGLSEACVGTAHRSDCMRPYDAGSAKPRGWGVSACQRPRKGAQDEMRPLLVVLIRHQKLYVISVTADLCGLTLVFTSIALPEHLKTVYIPQLTFCWPVRIKSHTDHTGCSSTSTPRQLIMCFKVKFSTFAIVV